MAANAEFFMSYAVVPDGPEHSHVEIRIRAEDGADGDALVAAARSFIEEDIHACERIQAGLTHPGSPSGRWPESTKRPSPRSTSNLLALLA